MATDLSAFLSSWAWDPTVIGGIVLFAALYAAGWTRISRRDPSQSVLAPWRAWCFGAGLVVLGVALMSPIAVFSELFFFMHMTQHLLLMVAVAPLLLLGAPLLPTLWALPRGARNGLGALFVPANPVGRVFGFLTRPLVAMSLYVVALALWHVPPLYDAAQGRTLIHDLEHFFFLGTSLLFWWPVIHPSGGRRRLGYGAAIPYFLPPMLEGNLIGALLTFADRPLYATYLKVPRIWGISALQDQQFAGLIMWVPGGLVYAIPIYILLILLFRQEQRDQDDSLRYNGRGPSVDSIDWKARPGKTGGELPHNS